MNAQTVMQVLEDGLSPVVSAHGGELCMASDPDDIIELLASSQPKGWRLIIGWAGESAVDVDDAPGIEDLRLTATVQAARGMGIDKGSSTFRETASGRASLHALAHQVDLWFRGFTGTTKGDVDHRGFRKVSSDWLVIDDIPTRQITTTYRLRIGTDKPQAEDEIELTWPLS